MKSQQAITFNVLARIIANQVIKDEFLTDTGINKRRFYLCSTERQLWHYDDLKKIANYFSCKLDDLFEEIPKKYIKN